MQFQQRTLTCCCVVTKRRLFPISLKVRIYLSYNLSCLKTSQTSYCLILSIFYIFASGSIYEFEPQELLSFNDSSPKNCYCKSGEERKLPSNEMSEVLCNVYVLFNCLYVCSCFSLYLYCICCIEEALMLAIDQPLHPHRKYRPPCCDFTAPNLHQMDPTVGQINRRLDLKDLQGKFVPKHFLVRNFEASGQMS